MNALNNELWHEIGDFTKAGHDADCRCNCSERSGKMFHLRNRFNGFSELAAVIYSEDDIARKSTMMQKSKFAKSSPPWRNVPNQLLVQFILLRALGAASTWSQPRIRVCTKDAWFQVKEVDMGLTADVGTCKAAKSLGSQSLCLDLCLTARKCNLTRQSALV